MMLKNTVRKQNTISLCKNRKRLKFKLKKEDRIGKITAMRLEKKMNRNLRSLYSQPALKIKIENPTDLLVLMVETHQHQIIKTTVR